MREGALRKNATRAVMYIFLIAVSLISVFPLYWSFISAFNNTQQILGGWLLPSTHLLENLQHLFEQHNVVRALKNSFATTLLQTFAALAVSSIAGYGFEIYHDKAKDTVMAILMLAMMVPFVAVLVPLFQMFTKAKLINSWTGFILPSIATPFLIMYFRNSARSFPRDTLEAARIDGLHPDDEADLRLRRDHHVHGRVERISLAEGRHADQRGDYHADAGRQHDGRLCHRLRRGHGGGHDLLAADGHHLLLSAKEFHKRGCGCSQMMVQ